MPIASTSTGPVNGPSLPTPADPDETIARAEALWQDFFALNQIADGRTDGAGGCALRLDSLPCMVRCWLDDGLLAVQLQVATLSTAPAARAALCEALLVQATDLIEGDVIGIHTATGTAVYQRLPSLPGLDAPALTAVLWDMADGPHRPEPAGCGRPWAHSHPARRRSTGRMPRCCAARSRNPSRSASMS